jgi:hypothetical protein
LYRRRGTLSVVCVVRVASGRRPFVTIRVAGEERNVDMVAFLDTYQRCRPDGSLM